MNRRLPYFIFLLSLLTFSVPAAAQHPLVKSLAAKFCTCMEEGTVGQGQEMARMCFDSLATLYQVEILRVLELDVEKRSHRLRLTNELIDPLTLNCPILQTLSSEPERESRWSDIKAVEPRMDRYQSPKSPPADPAGANTTETPSRWQARGRLQGRPAGGSFSLLLADGTVQSFELPFGILGKRRLKTGEEVTVIYRREWHKGEASRVVNVVIKFE